MMMQLRLRRSVIRHHAPCLQKEEDLRYMQAAKNANAARLAAHKARDDARRERNFVESQWISHKAYHEAHGKVKLGEKLWPEFQHDEFDPMRLPEPERRVFPGP